MMPPASNSVVFRAASVPEDCTLALVTTPIGGRDGLPDLAGLADGVGNRLAQ